MENDIDISRNAKKINIVEIAKKIDLDETEFESYGKYMAKLNSDVLKNRKDNKDGKLILVTSINPTPAGEGKTTVNIGLSQGLNRLGVSSISMLREPSLGPSFGLKGGATGGGYSQVLPMEDINLHFTGDFHGITYANNLISSMIDNHLHHGNELNIDPKSIKWKRCIDLNDRSLRKIIIGMGSGNGVLREDGFNITAASEMMAILCLSEDIVDLKEKVKRILIGFTKDKKPVYVKNLKCEGAVCALLKDAIKPNLVQTTENTPAIIHGGPFANIAHGCNSIIGTRMSMKLCDYTVTEAGFGADLGAEKFFNIKCRLSGIKPNCVVIVATIKALKYNGGVKLSDLDDENLEALKTGFSNLEKHIKNMESFGIPLVVAINKYQTDSDEEINLLQKLVNKMGYKAVVTDVWKYGGKGSIDLAEEVIKLSNNNKEINFTYKDDDGIKDKILKVSKNIYGAKDVEFSDKAQRTINEIDELGLSHLPICISKTQYSLSDDKSKLGAPKDFTIHVNDIEINSGAGFIVVILGKVLRMPGLPKKPAAESIDIDKNGVIRGLF